MKIGLDLDGTLLDCQRRQTALLAAMCRACALPIDVLEHWQLKRMGYSNRLALEHMGVPAERAEAVAALWEHAIEDVCWLRFDAPLRGALEVLLGWREQGHSLHLVSARRNHAHARQQLCQLGLDRVFASVDLVDPFDAHAKAPVLARLRPGLYIGDTERDAQCAQSQGIAPALVATGLRARRFLQRSGDWPVADSLADVHLASTTHAQR